VSTHLGQLFVGERQAELGVTKRNWVLLKQKGPRFVLPRDRQKVSVLLAFVPLYPTQKTAPPKRVNGLGSNGDRNAADAGSRAARRSCLSRSNRRFSPTSITFASVFNVDRREDDHSRVKVRDGRRDRQVPDRRNISRRSRRAWRHSPRGAAA
jgi:hypothetical protein